MTQHTDSLILTWLATKRREDVTRWWSAEAVARGIGIELKTVQAALDALFGRGAVLRMVAHREYWKGAPDGDR